MSSNGELYSTIYDAVMKLLVNKRVAPDELASKIAKMHLLFADEYPEEQLDEEALLRQVLFDHGVLREPLRFLRITEITRNGLQTKEHPLSGSSGAVIKNILKSKKSCRRPWLPVSMRQLKKF